MIESENGPAGDEKLTFRYMHGIIPRHDLREIRGVHDEYGGFSQLALLISDQCPFGITVLLPGKAHDNGFMEAGPSRRCSGSPG